MNLVGKSHDAIATELRGVKRAELIAIIQEHVTLEPFFSPEQVARARGVSKASIMRLIRGRQIRAHMPVHNRWRIPLSAVLARDEQTKVIG